MYNQYAKSVRNSVKKGKIAAYYLIAIQAAAKISRPYNAPDFEMKTLKVNSLSSMSPLTYVPMYHLTGNDTKCTVVSTAIKALPNKVAIKYQASVVNCDYEILYNLLQQ